MTVVAMPTAQGSEYDTWKHAVRTPTTSTLTDTDDLQSGGQDSDDFESDVSTASEEDEATELLSGNRSLMLGLALSLQQDLLQQLNAPTFQAELLSWLREVGGPDSAFTLDLKERDALVLSAVREVLHRHGFEGSIAGFGKALCLLEALSGCSTEIVEGVDEIYDSLGLVPRGRLLEHQDFQAVPWAMA